MKTRAEQPGWHILLVDDDEDDFILTRDMLTKTRRQGIQLEWASSYAGGIEALTAGTFDAVLTDYDLGAQTGINLIREVAEKGVKTPVILLTGRGGYEVDLDAMQAGAEDYLDKSEVTPALLERSIRFAIERRRSEEALRQANLALGEERARLKAVIENALSGIVFTDRDGKFIVSNPAVAQLFRGGLTGDAAGPQGGYALHHPDGTPFLTDDLPLVRALSAGISSENVEMVARYPDGQETHLLANASPLFDSENQVSGAVAVMQDVTGLMQARQATEQQRTFLQDVLQYMPVGVIIAEAPSGRLIFGNERVETIWGKPFQASDSIAQYGEYAGHHPDGRPYQPEEWPLARSIMNGEGVVDEEIHILRGDGSEGVILTNSQPIYEGGKIAAGVMAFYDLTERKQLERTLRESDERFRVGLSCAPVMVFTTDRQLHYTWVYNPQTGLTQEQMIGKRDDEIEQMGETAELMALKQRVIDTGHGVQQELSFKINGEWRIYSITFEPLHGEENEITGITGSKMDITNLRRLESQEVEYLTQIEVQHRLFQHREDERLQIARDLHDGPVQELVGTSMAMEEALNIDDREERLVKMRAIQDSLRRQISDLRAFCTELRPPSLAPFGLEKAIRSHIHQFQERHKDIKMAAYLQKDGRIIPEEKRMALYRIYQELLNNIVKHARANQIIVNLWVDETEVILQVEDNGIGFSVPTDWLALARSGHLGLIGMRERVEATGGKLEIRSHPGSGTQVKVSVPR